MAEFDLWPAATQIANKVGVDPALFRGLIRAESGGVHFKDDGTILGSSAGAMGYTQLLAGTAAGMGFDPTDPWENLMGGATYLKKQLDAFGGDVRLALAAYNAGPNAVRDHGNQVPDFSETQAYVKKILAYMKEYPGNNGGGPSPEPQGPGSEVPVGDRGQAERRLILDLFEGGVTTKKLTDFVNQRNDLHAQQLQDTRTKSELKSAEEKENPSSKKSPSSNRTSAPANKEWSALKGVGNTTPKFMIMAIKKAEELGLAARENPYRDEVDPVHTEGSFHYRLFPGEYDGKKLGRGLDVSGDAGAMDEFFRWAIRYRPNELFYDPLGQYDSGRYSTNGIGGHGDHVHLSV